jgi:hypothetical protein
MEPSSALATAADFLLQVAAETTRDALSPEITNRFEWLIAK